jgi:putative endonuclease
VAAMRQARRFFVYILSSKYGVLYTGVTNDIERRLHEHKMGTASSFTKRYRVTRLVHLEEFDRVDEAIERETEIKGWVRKKKLDLIRSQNPKWEDFGES